jgi:hypothetical protein
MSALVGNKSQIQPYSREEHAIVERHTTFDECGGVCTQLSLVRVEWARRWQHPEWHPTTRGDVSLAPARRRHGGGWNERTCVCMRWLQSGSGAGGARSGGDST